LGKDPARVGSALTDIGFTRPQPGLDLIFT